jgi:hypothetical protein
MRAAPGALNAPVAAEALAACEASARLRGHSGFRSAYTEPLDDWVRRTRLMPPEAMVRDALAALERITGSDSELADLWRESNETGDWLGSAHELRLRLLAAPRPLGDDAAPPTTAHGAASTDPTGALIGRAAAIRFEIPALPFDAPIGVRCNALLAADALCHTAAVREAIAGLWQAVSLLDNPAIAWDLAVREARSWALEGRLDDALGLAREHEAYCPDVVEQGAGSTGKLAATLLGAPHWYFWWD